MVLEVSGVADNLCDCSPLNGTFYLSNGGCNVALAGTPCDEVDPFNDGCCWHYYPNEYLSCTGLTSKYCMYVYITSVFGTVYRVVKITAAGYSYDLFENWTDITGQQDCFGWDGVVLSNQQTVRKSACDFTSISVTLSVP